MSARATKVCHLVRTVVGDSKDDLKAAVRSARADGWTAIGKGHQLFVGGHPVKGRASWIRLMEKRS
jgi:hypothetical protein